MKNIEVASSIPELRAAKVESETMLADCIKTLASEKELLDSLNAEPITPENEAYLKQAKKSCQLSITAWEHSIIAIQCDIDTYEQEISAILKRNPEMANYVDISTGAILH